MAPTLSRASDADSQRLFDEKVQPILSEYCYDCHGNGQAEAGVAFDEIGKSAADAEHREVWWKALKQVRAGLMPKEGPKPTAEQIAQLEAWIKSSAFGFDSADPDPGHVTVRRLNRVEYKNTIRDLLGVDYDVDTAFPPDDTGGGFDTIGDVLSVSPMLLEKYIEAATDVVARAVPMAARTIAERKIPGEHFHPDDDGKKHADKEGPLSMSYYEPATVSTMCRVEHAGRYKLFVDVSVNEKYVDGVFDYNKCKLRFEADGQTLHEKDYGWDGDQPLHYEFDQDWQAGEHQLAFQLLPLTPDEKQARSLVMRIHSVTLQGPAAKEYWVRPANYEKYFPHEASDDPAERRQYARELLAAFAARAFRRPADEETLDRLTDLAKRTYNEPGRTFEAGVAKGFVCILASPRFLFRQEGVEPNAAGHPLVDEYALAARLSYFLWSTMPDEELTKLACEHRLRENLATQIERMLADPKAEAFSQNFIGQWLQARDIETVLINPLAVVQRDDKPNPDAERDRARFRELRQKDPNDLTAEEKEEMEKARASFLKAFAKFRQFELNDALRHAMRQETQMQFAYIVHENRSLLELLDCDYAFLNERLAKHYGIPDVTGDEMRLVHLPADSPRGGVLTQGTFLVVTSNPDRTSPVKRGLFILDNILGTPPAPPPPNIPQLNDEAVDDAGHPPTLKVSLERHRSDPLCMSCHARMDPLGLALENFNALGMWRDKERGQALEVGGKLATGEEISGIRDLKHVLATEHHREFYRTLTEKMLTYALGRGLDYYDVGVVDQIVDELEQNGGKPSALIRGIVESAPFEKRRADAPETVAATSRSER